MALLPRELLHTEIGLEQMAYAIIALGEDARVVMETIGRYYEPVAAALYIKQSGGGSILKVIPNGVKRRPSVMSRQRPQFLTELRPLISRERRPRKLT